ncbi:MAG: hypothetical protein F4Y53_00820 [Proteobacteria bacterium]|nr:hypothetical protein [Pseudomonadota bacterium]
MLDDAHWPDASRLIDESCGAKGSILIFGNRIVELGDGRIVLSAKRQMDMKASALRHIIPIKLLAFVLFIAVLTACSSGIGPDVKLHVDDALEAAGALINEGNQKPEGRPLVENYPGFYLSGRRIEYTGVPWLHEWVEVRVAELPMSMCLDKVLAQLPDAPSVVFGPDITQPRIPVTLEHRGPFLDFLNLLADASGYGWEEKGGVLYWSAEIVRVHQIHRVPGDLTYTMTTTEDGRGESGGLLNNNTEVGGNVSDSGIISLEGGGETFWDDLEATLNAIFKDPDINKTTIDRSSGTVILRGPANLVREAEHYLGELNHWLSRQVLLEVQLVKVTLSGNRNLGIDWNLVRNTASLAVTSTGGFAAAAAGARIGARNTDSSSIFMGSEVVINALEGQGQTSVQTSPRVVVLNGQAAQLQVLNNRSIVSSRSVTVTGGLLNTQTEDIQPSTVSTGIVLTILPKIIGERIFLQASIEVSDLVELRTEGSASNQVTLPHVQHNQFFQSARLESGETLALSGLVSRAGAEGGEYLPPTTFLGTSTQEYRSIETVLLITPTLLDEPSPDEYLSK